jgi:hypothetical protein
VQRFESGVYAFDSEVLRQNAERFSPENFRAQLSEFVDEKMSSFIHDKGA